MPLVLDYEPALHRPTKRRKLQEDSTMARRTEPEDKIIQRRGKNDETGLGAGSETPIMTEQPSSTAQSEIQTSDRAELIQCIKRGQRPTWVPKPGLKALYAEEEALQGKRNGRNDHHDPVSPTNTNFHLEDDLLFGPWVTGGANDPTQQPRSRVCAGYVDEEDCIDSARSSLENQGSDFLPGATKFPLRTSPPSWLESPLHSVIGRAVSSMQAPPPTLSSRTNRPRAPSLSSNFVMRVPTSPLVNAVNNPNLDFSSQGDAVEIKDGDKKGRRRTLGPSSFQSYIASSSDATTPNFSRPLPPPPLRRGSSLPHQTHQPRRSLGSFTHPNVTLQSPKSPGRRCSVADLSPKRRTSMVGSFEESILRGRMSSPASKPFDFVAQIGVMGKGDCPSNLKCPPHVSVPFQAVFYSYPSSQSLRSIADDAPSPYVGTIDVEHNLKPVQLATKRKRASTLSSEAEAEAEVSSTSSDPRAPENTHIGKALARDAQLQIEEHQPTKSVSRMSLGGAYRVPQQGQLQIIIKNSNKTAVKLFLVPYDLSGMEPGTKTFIRQRSYSSGPIVEGALSDRSQQPNVLDPLKDKHILRYLIHIRFCCPTKGKFYLYDNIRLVFANRVPDGKEKLRVEVQLPEPRYSPWKPVQTSQRSVSSSAIDFSPMALSSRCASSPGLFDDLHPIKLRDTNCIPEEMSTSPESTIPFHIPDLSPRRTSSPHNPTRQTRIPFAFPDIPGKDATLRQPERTLSPVQGFFASTSPRASPVPWGSSSSSTAGSFSHAPVEAGSGLLSRQFRGLQNSVGSSETEIVLGPRAATASLTRILSQSDTTSQEKEG